MKRIFALGLFALPLLYISSILAVSIHEIIGHGLTTHLLGGIFQGATVKLDALGWADVDVKGFPSPALIMMYLGGAASTGLLTIFFFGLGLSKRFTAIMRFSFVLIAFAFLQDGFPYYFWDGIFLGGIGDFSMIWNHYPSNVLRLVVVTLTGIGLSAGIVIFNMISYRMASSVLGYSFLKSPKQRVALSSILVILQAILWFAFDWNQIVPGVGLLPSIFGLALGLITILVMEITGRKQEIPAPEVKVPSLKLPLIVVWTICLGTILIVALWLQNGI